MGSNFALRAPAFWRAGGFDGFEPGRLSGEDLYLSWQVNQVARVLFDPELAVYSSARRVREGYLNYVRRTTVSAVSIVFLGQDALPAPDIR